MVAKLEKPSAGPSTGSRMSVSDLTAVLIAYGFELCSHELERSVSGAPLVPTASIFSILPTPQVGTIEWLVELVSSVLQRCQRCSCRDSIIRRLGPTALLARLPSTPRNNGL